MSHAENKQVVQQAFEGLAAGDGSSLVSSLSDDVRWRVTGTTAWSKTYEGRDGVVQQLLGPLQARLRAAFKLRPSAIIADGDLVVVQGRGEGNVTHEGRAYDNEYCFVLRFEARKIREVTEYLDTELVTTALGARE